MRQDGKEADAYGNENGKIIGLLKQESGSSQARPTSSNDSGSSQARPTSSNNSTSTQACSSKAIKEEVQSDNGNVSFITIVQHIVCTKLFFVQIALLRIRSSNPYAYGLHLLHSMFTLEELAGSLLFTSKKSGCVKPGLDPVRVEKLLGKRFISN